MQMQELFGVEVSTECFVSSITVAQKVEGIERQEVMTVEIVPIEGRGFSFDGQTVHLMVTLPIPKWDSNVYSVWFKFLIDQAFDFSATEWSLGKQAALVKGPNKVIGLLTSVTTELA